LAFGVVIVSRIIIFQALTYLAIKKAVSVLVRIFAMANKMKEIQGMSTLYKAAGPQPG
jgi:hypothetical protein